MRKTETQTKRPRELGTSEYLNLIEFSEEGSQSQQRQLDYSCLSRALAYQHVASKHVRTSRQIAM